MFEFLGVFFWILLTGIAAIGGYVVTKRFVQERLRYVDAIHKPYIPAVSGVVAAGLALPIAGLLPFVGLSSAVLFGIGVGSGVASGRREFKQLPP